MNKINEIDVAYLYQVSFTWMMDFIQMQEFKNKNKKNKRKEKTIENDVIIF